MGHYLLIFFSFTAAVLCANDRPKLPTGQDFTDFRMAYAARPDFSPLWKGHEDREALFSAYKEKDHQKVADLSKPWLEKVPVDADAHFIRAQALKKLGDWPGFIYHWHCFYGLLQSITASGDGKSKETAFKVISVAEEYYVLDEIGAELIEQTLDIPCDVMNVRLRDGTETTLYFDVSIPLKAMQRELSPQN